MKYRLLAIAVLIVTLNLAVAANAPLRSRNF
jgi:hypothetical protein